MRCVVPYLGCDGHVLENLQETTERTEAKTMTREIRESLIFMIILLAFVPVLAWAFLCLGP